MFADSQVDQTHYSEQSGGVQTFWNPLRINPQNTIDERLKCCQYSPGLPIDSQEATCEAMQLRQRDHCNHIFRTVARMLKLARRCQAKQLPLPAGAGQGAGQHF